MINLFIVLWSKVFLFFGGTFNESIIPEGPYCYKPDVKKNNTKELDNFAYYTIQCEYYKYITKNITGCSYLGIITDDFVFTDRCKMCGVNDYEEV